MNRYLPLLAVLAHTHSPPMARAGVAAGALAHLEADAAAGAAGRPGSPGSPGAVSTVTHKDPISPENCFLIKFLPFYVIHFVTSYSINTFFKSASYFFLCNYCILCLKI